MLPVAINVTKLSTGGNKNYIFFTIIHKYFINPF